MQQIEIVVIDALFPDGNSVNIISQIKNLKPEIKILVFSGVDESTQSIKYINAGANGFLSKLSEENDIKEAILKIHQTESIFPQLLKMYSLILYKTETLLILYKGLQKEN
ncbi:response regulator [Chryseobacterium indoltheticum]|uniref:response regulator n=1 Tax=Chryseobacterium indoltheticum TaxID=254 RepID=UPI003F497D95